MSSKKLLTIVESNVKQLNKAQIVNWGEDKYPVEVRAEGEFEKKAIFLSNCYEWVLGYDSFGQTILVALDPRKSSDSAGEPLLKPTEVTTDMA